jgi:hypothetical protein
MGAQERTFRANVVELDTSTVNRIAIRARKAGHEEAVLERKDGHWNMTYKGANYRADDANVNWLLGHFEHMKADRVVGTTDAVRDRYGLVDSLASTVELTTADGRSRKLIVGRSVNPEQAEPWTAVQIEGEQEVYATPGTLSSSVDNEPLTAWRPRVLITGDAVNWDRLTFTYPADSGYVLERRGAEWLVDSMPADTSKVNRFLKSLTLCKAQSFADTVNVDGLPLQYQLVIEDVARPEPIHVRVYSLGYGFVVTSNINPGTVMWFDALREVPRLFRPRHNWFATVPPPMG